MYMKYLMSFCVLLIFASNSFSQDKAEFKNDTLFYKSKKIYINQSIQLAYGSKSNKHFAFVYAGSGIAAAMCTPYWSKQTMIVNKIYEQNGTYWVRGTIGSKRIEFVVEGAIDNNEIYL